MPKQNVLQASTYRYSLGRERNGGGGPISQHLRLDDGREFKWTIQEIDENFFPMFGIDIISGRNFSGERQSDRTDAVILNETAVRILGWTDPIGQTFKMGGEFGGTRTVIGVVKDFHLQSLHERIGPVMIYMNPGFYRHIALTVNMTNFPETLKFLKRVWEHYLSERDFEFTFLQDRVMGAYRAELRLERIFNTFVGLAICIACLGLFGLAAFTTQRRTREIGIRKVLGATEPNIISLLSKDFAILVLIANILSWPFAYWAMDAWLQRFVYRGSLDIWPFFLSGLLAFLIASFTVGYQALKAARANPVDALRYE